MNLIGSASGWLAVVLLLFLSLAALEDLWRMEIEDWISGAVAVGAFLAVVLDGPIIELWQNLLLFAAVLGAGMWLFARGAMGGGDVKLLAASSLWFDLAHGWKLLVAVSILGGVETLIMLAVRLLPWPDAAARQIVSLRRDEGIPYGVAIAAGMVLMIAWLR